MRNIIGKYLKRQILDPIVDLFFPPFCYICDRYLPPNNKIICTKCWSEIPSFDGTIDQSLRNRSFNKLFILFEFEEKIRQLIHLFKYKRHLTLAEYFASEATKRFPLFKNNNYHSIVPVPLHKTKKRERGYNQSEEIAKALANIIHIPVRSEHIVRIRPTLSQTKMTKEEREKNVKSAFTCPVKLTNKNILLVDDVVTTGSTIEACAIALKKVGVNFVDVFVIAHPIEND